MIGRFVLTVLIALNQTGNALTGGRADESISSRLGDARDRGSKFARAACAVIEKVDFHPKSRPDHCSMAVLKHIEREWAGFNHAMDEMGRLPAGAIHEP